MSQTQESGSKYPPSSKETTSTSSRTHSNHRESPQRSPKRDRSHSPRGERVETESERAASANSRTLYISGLSSRTRESELETHFAKYGKVISCSLITDPRTGESRGFGFIQMDSVEQAAESIYHLDRMELDGRIITVEQDLFNIIFQLQLFNLFQLFQLVQLLHNLYISQQIFHFSTSTKIPLFNLMEL